MKDQISEESNMWEREAEPLLSYKPLITYTHLYICKPLAAIRGFLCLKFGKAVLYSGIVSRFDFACANS